LRWKVVTPPGLADMLAILAARCRDSDRVRRFAAVRRRVGFPFRRGKGPHAGWGIVPATRRAILAYLAGEDKLDGGGMQPVRVDGDRESAFVQRDVDVHDRSERNRAQGVQEGIRS
jgi:hypothetical protein